ncbi:MAG: TIGR04283 family arsenosugar biosynthesis glycosyltransferase [Geitlerinemataceae cyanobacterium]
MPSSRCRTIVFTRYPEPGRTKTRLIPGVGARGAALLQRWMTEIAIGRASAWAALSSPENRQIDRQIEVCFTGGDRGKMRRWLDCEGGQHRYVPQGEGDLGAKMGRALVRAWDDGYDRALIIGIDCPFVTADDLSGAFAALDRADIALGAARDGGYYLIAANRPPDSSARNRLDRALFSDIPWSTDRVLELTVAAAKRAELTVAMLPTYDDIDRPEDLPRLAEATGWAQRKISAIVPTYNEAGKIAATLQSLSRGQNIEILLADGGSRDETVEIARSQPFPVEVVTAKRRANQCNAAAEAATGEILLFVHGDTGLPEHFDLFVRGTLLHSALPFAKLPSLGAFELQTDSPDPAMRRVERWANWRSRYLNLPYGDQGLFLRAETFRELGGFPDLAIAEDYMLVRQAAKLGRIETLPLAVTTSARRWEKLGIWKTTAINQGILLGLALGVSPERLARWYRRS